MNSWMPFTLGSATTPNTAVAHEDTGAIMRTSAAVDAGIIRNCGNQTVVHDSIEDRGRIESGDQQSPHRNAHEQGEVHFLGGQSQHDCDQYRNERPSGVHEFHARFLSATSFFVAGRKKCLAFDYGSSPHFATVRGMLSCAPDTGDSSVPQPFGDLPFANPKSFHRSTCHEDASNPLSTGGESHAKTNLTFCPKNQPSTHVRPLNTPVSQLYEHAHARLIQTQAIAA